MILGMKISMDHKRIFLSLSYDTEKMLHKFDFYKYNSVSTPYDSSIALKKNMDGQVSQLIGSLLYGPNET